MHFCDAFAVAIDEFYNVSINGGLLKPLVQTQPLDDLNRAAAEIDRVTPAAKAVRLLDHRNAHAVTGKPVRGSRSGNTGARDEDVFYHFDFPMNIRTPTYRRRPQKNRSEEHTSELQSLMRISYAVFCLKTKKNKQKKTS